jgi:hypothetical protein
MYITLEQAKQHLNIDQSYSIDDEYITQLIGVAEDVVSKHIDDKLIDIEIEAGVLPASIVHAMLLLIGNFYANREPVAFASSNEIPLNYQYLLSLYKHYK